MQKVKANARWNELSVEQRETLDRWLFDEKLSYRAAWPRAQAELGFKGSLASLKRYSVRRDKERILTEFKDLRQEVAAISGAPVGEKELRAAAMKVLGRFLFRQVRQSPEKVKEWGMVASLMVDNDRNELMRELKGEELRMRQEAMAFAKERFEWDTMERALKALPQLLELAEAKKDPETKHFEENAYWNGVRLAMFGPLRGIHAETAEEEEAMIAAKRAREARKQREAERARARQEINDAEPPPPMSPYYPEYIAKTVQWEEEYWHMGAEYEI